MLAQAMSKSGFGKCLGIVVCAYLFLCGPTTLAKSQSLSELTEMAAYVAELNDMTAQVSRIFEETSGYDDLATGILEKQITQSYNSTQTKVTMVQINGI